MDIYDKYIKKLLDKKKAYYCFDTTEELDAYRKEAEAQKREEIKNPVQKSGNVATPTDMAFALTMG